MRIINADKLKSELEEAIIANGDMDCLDFLRVASLIDAQPTVYDWIPCEKELPKIPNSYLVTKMCENDGNPIYETSHEIFWTCDRKWDCERDEDCDWKVIAWQSKFKPYQPKDK